MKKVIKLATIAVVVISAASLSSCNRGYGCPTDLKAAVHAASVIVGK
jgi:predicted small secreted protein